MITVTEVRGERNLGYSGGPDLIPGVLRRGEPVPAVVRERDRLTEESQRCEIAGFEAGGRGAQGREPKHAGKSKDTDVPPGASRRNVALSMQIILQLHPFWTSNMQNDKNNVGIVLSHYILSNLLQQ